MRCLHVIDALRPSPLTAALAGLLGTRLRAAGESDVHDVLAFSGGTADEAVRARARRVFVAGVGIDVAAVVHARAYDVIHAVDASAAHRIAPLILGSSSTPFVYSGRALAQAGGPTFGRAADESLAAAADLTILDASADSSDLRADLGSRIVRLDLARSGLVPADGSALSLDALPPRAPSILREWLACLARGGRGMNMPATMAGFPYDLYRAIGDDRYVTPGELPPESGDTGRALWEVYDRHFGRFTGAGLDPGFTRFVRTDVPFALPRFSAGSPVVVAGGGPGLDAVVADLRAVRGRVLVVTDPAGAAALQRHALTPDLVLVERQPGGREDAPLGESLPLGSRAALLIEPSAPIAAFERGAGIRRLARDLPSWGVWPATAVAVALRGGATRLITIGLDGTTDTDERARTDALLSALAVYAGADCLEVGPQSGRTGWWPVSWPNVVPIDAPGSAALSWHELGGTSLLRAEAERDLLFLAPLLPHAREALALARRARAGEAAGSRDLCRAIEMLLVWGADPSIRWALQRALGLTFLPRLWRTGVSMASPQRLWRPIVLALHELVEQADRFESRLTTLAHAAPRNGTASSPADAEPRAIERRRPSRVETDRVSVVIPVLDDHPHLEDAIASLAEQTYGEVEILIVHDAARTPRCEALRALPLSNMRVLAHTGPYVEALNAGLEAATGTFVVIHGADDRSHPQRLARQVAYLKAHPEIGVLASATGTLDAKLAASHREDAPADDAPSWTPDAIEVRLRSGPCFDHGSAIARRADVRDAGGYQLRAGSPPDHDLWLRLMPQVRFAKLPTRLYLRRPRG